MTSHVIESLRLPEPELIAEFLGDPEDRIDSPTPAQAQLAVKRIVTGLFGEAIASRAAAGIRADAPGAGRAPE